MTVTDNRKFPRVDFREAVAYRFEEKPVFAGSLGYDLSQGGVRFCSENFLPCDACVVLNLQLKIDQQATLDARVVWVQRVAHSEIYQIGCEFLDNRGNVLPRFVVKNFLELYKS